MLSVYFLNSKAIPEKKSISFGKLFDAVSFKLNTSLMLSSFFSFDFLLGVVMYSKT